MDTVLPLAKELGIIIDVSCDKSNATCVKDAIATFSKNDLGGNVLVAWSQKRITNLVSAMGVGAAVPTYPANK